MPKGDILSWHLACVGASIPLLVWFYFSQHEYIGELPSDIAEKWLAILYASGAASAFAGYILLMAVAGLAPLAGFFGGVVVGGLIYCRIAKLARAQQCAPEDP